MKKPFSLLTATVTCCLAAGLVLASTAQAQSGNSLTLQIDNSAPIHLDAEDVVYNLSTGTVTFVSVDPFFCFDFSDEFPSGQESAYTLSAVDSLGNLLVDGAVDLVDFSFRTTARQVTMETGRDLNCFATADINNDLMFALLGADQGFVFASRFQVNERSTGSLQITYGTYDNGNGESGDGDFVPTNVLVGTNGMVEYSIVLINQGPETRVAFQEASYGDRFSGRQWRCEFVGEEPEGLNDHPCSADNSEWTDGQLRLKEVQLGSTERIRFHVRWDETGPNGPFQVHAGATAVGLNLTNPLGNTATLNIES